MMQLLSRSLLRGATCALCVMGCGSGPSDATKLSSAHAPLAEDEVLVTSTSRFHTSVGIAERLDDLSANPPEIHLQTGASFIRITGTPVAGGWLFTGVPRTEYYLRTHPLSRADILTSARHVDIGTHHIGRADAEYPGVDGVPVQLNLRNLSPWRRLTGQYQPGSSLQAVATDVDMVGDLLVPENTPEGATSIVTDESFLVAYNLMSMPVFQANAGDRMYVHQSSEFTAGGMPDGTRVGYSSVERSVHLPPLDFVPEWGPSPLTIDAELQPLPLQEFPLDWRLSEFAPQASQVHPRALPGTIWFEIHPTPHTSAEQWMGFTQPLLRLLIPRGSASDFAAHLRYGNPYPSSWDVVGRVNYSTVYAAQMSGNPSRTINLVGGYTAVEKLEDLASGPIAPKLSPPRSLRIDWKSASTSREVSSVHPVISWRPPAVGTPTAYRVIVRQLFSQFGTTSTTGSISVPASIQELRLPPGLLTSGPQFYVSVIAVNAPHWDVEQAPLSTQERVPYHSATAYSSIFTVAP
ncbi:hypothetical protein LXT21_03020 [Myxococcus sp. K38C18041901]|uniref:hypothetical protein n=1 Tax=Myxococcus guangdongensis TaxID=2906760 RepID=UPI0020A81BAB|nr:hypothetical protein [Myxococcus guangdongensis]MCP3057744.1 hypothetical protein [Myxococcus guangdongensis]